jgi:hypothetical protein
MRSRILHAVSSCAVFILIATCFGALTGNPIELVSVAAWSALGIGSYIAFSHLFGFDPHRTRIAQFASDWVHYVDRWELRLGQATLSMLGFIVLSAKLLHAESFALAVVSGTLSAWTYFAFRLYAGGYHSQGDRSARLAR